MPYSPRACLNISGTLFTAFSSLTPLLKQCFWRLCTPLHRAAPCGCRGAAPCSGAERLRARAPRSSVSLRAGSVCRSVIAPWLLRGRSGPAPCALRLQPPQRATGVHAVPLPAYATACTRHALPWQWPWALPACMQWALPRRPQTVQLRLCALDLQHRACCQCAHKNICKLCLQC